MKDALDMVPLKLKGDVKVELFDSEGDKVFEQKGSNYISYGMFEFLRRLQKTWLTSGLPNNIVKPYTTAVDYSKGNVYFAKYLVLTDYDAPEDAGADAMVQGNMTGWCDTSEQSYSDLQSGLLNVTESYVDLDKIHLVFDFATDRANGTFRSVYLANGNQSMYVFEVPLIPVLNLARQYNESSLCYHDSYFWAITSEAVYKLSPTTGEEVAQYDIGISNYATMVYGEYIYILNRYQQSYTTYHARLYRYEISSGNLDTGYISLGDHVGGTITNDGTYIYASNGYEITKVDIATFTIVESKTFGTIPRTIFYKNGYIYGNSSSDSVAYRYDFENGTSEPTIYNTLGKQIATVGGVDYVLDRYETRYKRQGGTYITQNYMLCTTSLFSKSGINAMTRKRLAAPVTKDNTQTMKITYEIEFS